MLDQKMDPDLLLDVREFLVSTLEDEKLSVNTGNIRMDLIRRLSAAQNLLAKPYQDMKSSPKKDKSSSELIIQSLSHLHLLHHDHENAYENETSSSAGSTSGAGSIECYEEIDHVNPAALGGSRTYENISKISPSPSTMSVLSTSQYKEVTAHISSNVHVSAQYENTKQMLDSMNPSIMSTKHGQVEIVNKNGPKSELKSGDTVDGELRKLSGPTSLPNGLNCGLKADRKASNGSVVSLHDIKFSAILPLDVNKETDATTGKHKALNGSVSFPLGGQQNNNIKIGNSSNSISNSQNHSNTLPASSSSNNLTASSKNLTSMNSNNVDILSISASALKYSAARCGNLLKKEKILFVDHFKKYWVALVNGYLYLYTSDKENKASSVINVAEGEGGSIYSGRPSMSKEKEHLFEIVAPGQKTHYFAANSTADMDLWISTINNGSQNMAANGSTRSSPPPSITSSSSGNNYSSPSKTGRQSTPPASRPLSEACRELPSLPVGPDIEQYYDEPDALIRPVLHNYEHMMCQDALYNEIDEKESINENYYNNISHSPKLSPHKTDSTALARKPKPKRQDRLNEKLSDQEKLEKARELSMLTYDHPVREAEKVREQESRDCEKDSCDPDKLRELCMQTYDQPRSSRKCIVEMDEFEEAEDEKNCEETTDLFQNNCQSSRIQHIIQRMEASINTKDFQETTPPLRRSKRPESQLIVSNLTYEPIQRKSTNRNSR